MEEEWESVPRLGQCFKIKNKDISLLYTAIEGGRGGVDACDSGGVLAGRDEAIARDRNNDREDICDEDADILEEKRKKNNKNKGMEAEESVSEAKLRMTESGEGEGDGPIGVDCGEGDVRCWREEGGKRGREGKSRRIKKKNQEGNHEEESRERGGREGGEKGEISWRNGGIRIGRITGHNSRSEGIQGPERRAGDGISEGDMERQGRDKRGERKRPKREYFKRQFSGRDSDDGIHTWRQNGGKDGLEEEEEEGEEGEEEDRQERDGGGLDISSRRGRETGTQTGSNTAPAGRVVVLRLRLRPGFGFAFVLAAGAEHAAEHAAGCSVDVPRMFPRRVPVK